MGEERIQKSKEVEQERLRQEKELKDASIVAEQNVSVSALLKKNKEKAPLSPTNRRKATKRRKKKGIAFAELNGSDKPFDDDDDLAERLRQRKEKQDKEKREKELEQERLRKAE